MKLINAGIELATLFQRYARKILMREGEGIMKIPSQKKVEEFAENIYQDFKSSGVPNNVIKTEKDIGRFHKQITDIEEKARKKWWDNQLKKPPELADVFDLQGNRIRDTSKIMGGQELPGEINIFSNKYLNDLDKKIIDSDAFGYSQKEWNALSNSSKEKFRKQFDSNYADAMENTQMATLKEIGSIDLPEIPKPKKLDPALYEDRGGNIIPAQFKDVVKETDEQIIARIEKQNKEAAERLRNKKNKDLEDPEKFAAGGVAGLLGERTGYAVGNQVMPAVDPRMNVDYNTLVDQNTAQRATQAQARNPVIQRMQQNQANQTSLVDRMNQHNDNNQLLRNAHTAGKIDENQYKRMGGYDVAQQTPGGILDVPAVAAASLGYNFAKSGYNIKDPNDPNAQFGKYGPAESTELNVRGATGLNPTDLQLYNSLINDTYATGPAIMERENMSDVNKEPISGKLNFIGGGLYGLLNPATAAEPSAMPQGSPGQLNPTMADVAGPKEGYISLKEYEDMQRNNMYDFTKSPGMRNRPKEEIEQTIKDIVSAASKDPDNYLRNYRGNFDSIISNRLASGGRAGLYQGGQAQIEPDLSNIGHGSDALMARNMLIAPGSQATTSTGLNYLLGEDNDTTRVPYKEKGSVTLADLIKINASGNKSGKNQIMGAPEGITADTETFNAIIKMDIPVMEKINLLGSYGYGKDRFKVEKGNKELFLGEGGYKDRNIGLGVNQGGEGLSGSVIRNLETGDNDYQLKFLKSFAEGGRAGYNEGNTVLPKPKPMNEYLLEQVMSQAGVNTLDPRTRQMFIEELKKKIRDENSKAEGGRVPMWLGGALAAGKSLTRELLKHMTTGSSHGKSPAEILKRVNPKQVEKFLNDPSLPFKFSSDTGIMGSDMIKDLIKQTKTDRQYVLEQLLNSARNIKKGDDNLLTYKNQIIEEMVSTGMDRKTAKDFTETLSESLLKEVGPKKGFPKVTEQGLLELENIQKNLLTKDRQLNAEGGLAGLLGESPRSVDHGPRNNYKEAGVVDKIGGMVNYKNVPHYLAKPLKGVTNIAEWVGKLPFAATELASDMIRKPLFKAGDKIPGLPGVGAKFVGGEMFEKFGDNMEVGGLSEKLGITALAENTGKNLTDEARTIGDLAELGGEFANMGGIFAAGKNLFKGSDSLKKLSQSLGKVKEGKTLEKLVDETLTANGEGRRDFNKLVASGGLMVALQSIGLGGIKAAKTKAAPDAVFTLKTIIDDSDEMTENGLMAMGRAQSFIDVSGFTDAVKKSLAVIMKNRKNQLGEKVLKNKVKGKDGKFTDDYEYIPTEEAAYIMEELQKRGHNIKFEHYDDMGGQGVDDILDKFKNNDFYKGTKLGKENYDKFSKKVAKMTDKEKFAYHSSITDDGGQYYDEFVEELLDMNFKNSTK